MKWIESRVIVPIFRLRPIRNNTDFRFMAEWYFTSKMSHQCLYFAFLIAQTSFLFHIRQLSALSGSHDSWSAYTQWLNKCQIIYIWFRYTSKYSLHDDAQWKKVAPLPHWCSTFIFLASNSSVFNFFGQLSISQVVAGHCYIQCNTLYVLNETNECSTQLY